MAKSLIIVESPTKVKTIKKYVGKDFNVISTVGHIKDLPPKELGVDTEKNFKAKYINIKGKSKVIKSLKAAASNAKDIYLAPDPDREGEAIAWHIASVLKNVPKENIFRIEFNEITKNAIREAVKNPRTIDPRTALIIVAVLLCLSIALSIISWHCFSVT